MWADGSCLCLQWLQLGCGLSWSSKAMLAWRLCVYGDFPEGRRAPLSPSLLDLGAAICVLCCTCLPPLLCVVCSCSLCCMLLLQVLLPLCAGMERGGSCLCVFSFEVVAVRCNNTTGIHTIVVAID